MTDAHLPYTACSIMTGGDVDDPSGQLLPHGCRHPSCHPSLGLNFKLRSSQVLHRARRLPASVVVVRGLHCRDEKGNGREVGSVTLIGPG